MPSLESVILYMTQISCFMMEVHIVSIWEIYLKIPCPVLLHVFTLVIFLLHTMCYELKIVEQCYKGYSKAMLFELVSVVSLFIQKF